ncbi:MULTISPECIES: Fe-S cluster assembly protein SufD [unclassified Polaromonas]|uniref:Fe-S cluster assembly protein SufD n=1 Tax=unclassified Polaromonas TaxID=2638319 RepID=UPI0018CAD119|nr:MULTISPECIES: Fe-S cluster assembly protein SufD [unclassified Polaromonas]MBG6073652.1 Fe-S cluster assembly protein SufD [Polaromonas sp. CG_9.7]MBG6078048.1 Fe-S cluster assembly protein SufD [Polaromonas sp. CG_9.11]MBG6115654.1 Fe-S cluster assembly protein SufD [Polaromonas sp. CG_9.2]MDH6186598.1 Fe-S cluster assembly protein SufD [Polaromonas sp. CG_23.6]
MNSAIALRPPTVDHLGALLANQPLLAPSPWVHVNALREQAHAALGALAMPTLRDEAWRFTSLAPLHRLTFQPVQAASRLQLEDIAPFCLDDVACRLVFVDGIYAPQLSSPAPEGGVVVTNLLTAMATHAAALEAQFGRRQMLGDNVFAALNTAFMQDAAVVLVPRHVALAAPVHLLFVATQAGALSHPRCLVLAEAGSRATLVEDYVALQDAAYLVNPVTEIVLADQAQLTHVRVQRDGPQAFHIANGAVSVGRSANYQSVSVAMGAQLSRYHLSVVLGEGAECAVDGLALLAGSQLADTHSCIDHAQPHGTSRQLHKCIAEGSAHAVFNGKVIVRPGAQRTDSAQSSRNLLLSSRAQVDTQPQLEIFADDVKCTHGATIGQLDAEEVFYLQSRGLSGSAARQLLTYAFGAEILERIPVASLKHQLQQRMLAQTGSQP